MGQYYYPIIFCYDEDGKVKILAWLYSHAYGNGLKLMEHSYVGNNFVGAVESLLIPGGACHNQRVVWAGDYADEEPEGGNLQSIADDKFKDCLCRPKASAAGYSYIVNHSKHQFVKKPESGEIHPLPLLTAEGNGRGGGDYNGSDMRLVGIWARDIISIEKEAPADYSELRVNFME